MQDSRFRITIRRILTAVAVFAIALSYRMSGEYLRRAQLYTRIGESVKNLAFHVESGETPLLGYTAEEKRKIVDQSREWIAYADRMRRKYEVASYLPWLTIQPDPPPPGMVPDGEPRIMGRRANEVLSPGVRGRCEMPEVCEECGAAVPEGGTCGDNLNALLLLEWQIPGGMGSLAHFYAVAAYNLQHPRSMNFTVEALNGLREAVLDSLEGRATIEEIRLRARRGAAAAGRVTRRPGDPEVKNHVTSWPMTIAEVLTVESDQEAYFDRVSCWARSATATLEAAR